MMYVTNTSLTVTQLCFTIMTKVRKELQLDTTGKFKVVATTKKQKPKNFTAWSMVGEATGLGLSISLPMALGALIGVWLDKKFAMTPKLTLSFMVLGVFIGIYNFYLYIKRVSKKK